MVGLTILWTAPWETKFRSCCYQSFEFRRSIIMWNRYLYLILIVLIMVITMMIRITIMVKMIIEKLSNREKLGMLFLLVFEEKMKLKTNEVKAIWIFFKYHTGYHCTLQTHLVSLLSLSPGSHAFLATNISPKYLPKGLNFQIHCCSLEKLIISTTLLEMSGFSGAKYLRLELKEKFIISGPQLTKLHNWPRFKCINFIKWVKFPREHSVSIYSKSY